MTYIVLSLSVFFAASACAAILLSRTAQNGSQRRYSTVKTSRGKFISR